MTARHPIRLGISACLLGERVRYDGGHKLDPYISDTLGRHFEWVRVCPEVAIGLGVPRPPIRLTGSAAAPRAVGVADPQLDVTAKLAGYGRRMARELTDISGYILKSRSPSCGVDGVKVHGRRTVTANGRGIYAAAFIGQHPLLPVEQEEQINDAERRDNFLERVFAYHRWQGLLARGINATRLVDFHAAHKLALMAHGRTYYATLGRLAALATRANARAIVDEYGRRFMSALAQPTTRGRHADALTHASGFLKQRLEPGERAELREQIEAYRVSEQPLIVPVALLRYHFRKHPDPWIGRQVYLYPDASELALRYR